MAWSRLWRRRIIHNSAIFRLALVLIVCAGLWTLAYVIGGMKSENVRNKQLHWLYRRARQDSEKHAAEDAMMPLAPFEDVSPENAKLVILLSYQRCGSTLVGQLFNTNPSVFYQFEPLDSLYSSLYGTEYNWNVPTDITSHRNGSARHLPDWEIKEVSTLLSNLLQCRFDRLRTEVLHNIYQFISVPQFQSTTDYIRCINNPQFAPNQCNRKRVSSYCGKRFNKATTQRMIDCVLLLRNSSDTTVSAEESVRAIFGEYRTCQSKLRRATESQCLEHLRTACNGKSIRAVKTVRATMDSVELLLQSSRNARVIHLIRDPRGVARSRYVMKGGVLGIHGDGSTYNKSEAETVLREAHAYCQAVTNDVRKRLTLEQQYPGRILTVIYDELVTDLQRYVEKIYRFLDMKPLENDVVYKMLSVPVKVRGIPRLNLDVSPEEIANKWQQKMTKTQQQRILDVCMDFYNVVKYDWKK